MRKIAVTAALVAAFAGKVEEAKTHALPSSWLRGALCVHSKEGAWNDRGAPYWGGMQMNMAFQRNYGGWALRRWGTADRWPVHAQLDVAYTGWKRQGWSAWPNTARACGLL